MPPAKNAPVTVYHQPPNQTSWIPPSSPSTVLQSYDSTLCAALTDAPLDLSEDARILYSSDSIVDVLGHTPDEVVNRPAWDFFHPSEIPLAKRLHSRGVDLDKASVLAYCQILNREGRWVTCECCFSVVYDVMVCCISSYRRDPGSESMLPSNSLLKGIS